MEIKRPRSDSQSRRIPLQWFSVQQKGRIGFEDIAQFRSSVTEAEFLFNADLSRFLANIDKTCFELWGALLAIDALRKDPFRKQ